MISWVRRHPVDSTLHEIKSLNYLNSILAKIEANNSGMDEAICLDKERFCLWRRWRNIFIGKNGRIPYPPICSGALPG